MRHDWLNRLVALCNPVRSKTRTNHFPALHVNLELHVFMSSFDWFTELSMSFVTSQRHCFWFWFDDRKPIFSTLNLVIHVHCMHDKDLIKIVWTLTHLPCVSEQSVLQTRTSAARPMIEHLMF